MNTKTIPQPDITGIRFLHYRAFFEDGELSHHGGATLGFRYNPESGELTAAAASCSLKDRYNKKIGRAKVAYRLGSKVYKETRIMDPEKYIAEMDAEMAQYNFKRLRVGESV